MRTTFIAIASALAIASPAVLAQAATTSGSDQAVAAAQGGTPESALASSLIDQNIETRNGEGIGRIRGIIIDPQSGRVQQVIVGVGGFLGIGAKDVALEWDQLQIEYAMDQSDRSQPPALGGAAPDPAAPTGSAAARAGEALVGEGPSASPAASAPMGAELAPRTTPARRAGVSTADLRIFVDLTREQLQAAPEYRDADEQVRATEGAISPEAAPAGSAGSGGSAGTTAR